MMIQALIENIFLVQVTKYIHSWTDTFDLIGVDLNLEYEFEYIYFYLITLFKFLMKRNKRVKFTGKIYNKSKMKRRIFSTLSYFNFNKKRDAECFFF